MSDYETYCQINGLDPNSTYAKISFACDYAKGELADMFFSDDESYIIDVSSVKPYIKNDKERQMWVMNDEDIYNWYDRENQSITEFIRQNREALDEMIAERLKEVSRAVETKSA